MPTPFEAEIGALMRDLKDPRAVAEDLARRWSMGVLSIDEQRDCAQFFNAAGLYQTLFQVLQQNSNDKAHIPWAQFSDAIGLARIKPTDAELDAIFEGAKHQSSLSDLVLSHQLDIWSRKFADARDRIQKLREEELEEKRQKLKDELDFLRANRLVGEEKRVLEEQEALFPSDEKVKEDREAYQLRWARDVLAKASLEFETPEAEDLARRTERLTPEQEAAKDRMVSRSKELAEQKPQLAYELSLALHFMDFHSEALEILNLAASNASTDWFRLELLIAARMFVDALTEGERIEQIYASDPESTFAAAYARARALKGLGQDALAIDLMRGLVRVRPGYRSAQSFLMDWSGGDE